MVVCFGRIGQLGGKSAQIIVPVKVGEMDRQATKPLSYKERKGFALLERKNPVSGAAEMFARTSCVARASHKSNDDLACYPVR